MKRRGFLRGLGFGGAVAAVVAPSQGRAAEVETRDLKWAQARCAEGHRVRLEAWRVPLGERKADSPGPGVATCEQGSIHGVTSVDNLIMTVGVMQGPWEIVPEEDHPKKPEPIQPVGEGVYVTGAGGPVDGGKLFLTGGDGAGAKSGGAITLTGGNAFV